MAVPNRKNASLEMGRSAGELGKFRKPSRFNDWKDVGEKYINCVLLA